MPEMRSVFSSHVDRIGYDMETAELHVSFAGGRTAVYADVPPDVAGAVLASPSIGQALHAMVRGRYRHSYVPARPGGAPRGPPQEPPGGDR